MKTDGWGTFMTTGKVSDYLNYKQTKNCSQTAAGDAERKDGQDDDRERASYRYGAFDHAGW